MRNILLLQLETKVALLVILIVVAIFLVTIFKSVNDFNKFIEHYSAQKNNYEEIRLEENP